MIGIYQKVSTRRIKISTNNAVATIKIESIDPDANAGVTTKHKRQISEMEQSEETLSGKEKNEESELEDSFMKKA